MNQVAAELGISQTGLTLNHSWVRALAGQNSGPVSMGNLQGQSGRYDGNPGAISSGGLTVGVTFSAPFIRGTISGITQGRTGPTQPDFLTLTFSANPNWSGNVRITNNTTGATAVLSYAGGNSWSLQNADSNIVENRQGQNDNFTILPSS